LEGSRIQLIAWIKETKNSAAAQLRFKFRFEKGIKGKDK